MKATRSREINASHVMQPELWDALRYYLAEATQFGFES